MPALMSTRTAPHPLLGRVLLLLLFQRSSPLAESAAASSASVGASRGCSTRRRHDRLACQEQEDDEPDSDDDASEWDDLPEEDVLDAFDQDDLEADVEPLDGWRGEEDDDEPNWFD